MEAFLRPPSWERGAQVRDVQAHNHLFPLGAAHEFAKCFYTQDLRPVSHQDIATAHSWGSGGQPLLKYFVQFRIEENLTDSERAQRSTIKID